MPTLLAADDRSAILSRLHRLQPTLQPQWGTLTAPRMICHLADQLRVGLGDLPTQRTDSLAGRTLVKWLVIHTPMQPPPGKVQTAPEMLTATPKIWEDDLAEVGRLVDRMGAGTAHAVHPYFGPLSPTAWGRLAWKHLDHHLRQFGC